MCQNVGRSWTPAGRAARRFEHGTRSVPSKVNLPKLLDPTADKDAPVGSTAGALDAVPGPFPFKVSQILNAGKGAPVGRTAGRAECRAWSQPFCSSLSNRKKTLRRTKAFESRGTSKGASARRTADRARCGIRYSCLLLGTLKGAPAGRTAGRAGCGTTDPSAPKTAAWPPPFFCRTTAMASGTWCRARHKTGARQLGFLLRLCCEHQAP